MEKCRRQQPEHSPQHKRSSWRHTGLDASSFDTSIERANGVWNSPNAERGPRRCASVKLAAAATLQPRCSGACCTGVAGSETRSSGRRSDPFRAPPLVGAQRVSGIHSQRRHLRRRRHRHRRRTQGGRRREALQLVLPPAWREDGRTQRVRAGGRRRHLAAYRQRRRIAERAINERRAASASTGAWADHVIWDTADSSVCVCVCACASAPLFVRECVRACVRACVRVRSSSCLLKSATSTGMWSSAAARARTG